MNISEKTTIVEEFMNKFLRGDIVIDYSSAKTNIQFGTFGKTHEYFMKYIEWHNSKQNDNDQMDYNNLIKILLEIIVQIKLEGLVVDLTRIPRE